MLALWPGSSRLLICRKSTFQLCRPPNLRYLVGTVLASWVNTIMWNRWICETRNKEEKGFDGSCCDWIPGIWYLIRQGVKEPMFSTATAKSPADIPGQSVHENVSPPVRNNTCMHSGCFPWICNLAGPRSWGLETRKYLLNPRADICPQNRTRIWDETSKRSFVSTGGPGELTTRKEKHSALL